MSNSCYRVWDKGLNKWLHGPDMPVNLFGEMHIFGELFHHHEPPYESVGLDRINDLVDMQYTGGCDKNGKLIFDSDILRIFSPAFQQSFLAVVFWNYDDMCWSILPRNDQTIASQPLTKWMHNDLEVVGNIWDNPDILKGQV